MIHNPTYLTLITILAILVFLSIEDENVIRWISLQLAHTGIKIQLLWYRFWYHPNNPYLKWKMMRAIKRIVKEMAEEAKASDRIKEENTEP